MRIIGTGSAHPKRTLTNDDLSKMMDTSDEWIRERTGICTRQIITDETLEELAAKAAQHALDDAGIKAEDLDYIICSNVVYEYATPTISSIVEGIIGASCPCVDLNAACSGFIYAIDFADALLQADRATNILVMAAEEPTRMVDWNDRSTCVLFGDGAGAMVVTRGDDLRAIKVSSKSNLEVLHYKCKLEPTPFITKKEEHIPLYMAGQEVFKTAVTCSLRDLLAVLSDAGLDKDDIAYYVLHQANFRINDFIRQRFNMDASKFPFNMDKYGNTSSASIPMLLDELNREGKLKKGDLLAFSAFGSGFTSGACIIEWNK
jgi:3-oxoacyl-[acyl-carrier-protein] synthase-3